MALYVGWLQDLMTWPLPRILGVFGVSALSFAGGCWAGARQVDECEQVATQWMVERDSAVAMWLEQVGEDARGVQAVGQVLEARLISVKARNP